MSELQDAETQASKLKTSIDNSVIVMGVFMGIFTVIYFIALFFQKHKYFSESHSKCDVVRFFVNYVTRIVCIAVAFSVKKDVTSFAKMFDFLKGANCSDDLTNAFFDTMTTELNSSIIRDLNVVSFFNVSLIVLDVVLLILSYFMCRFKGSSSFNSNSPSNYQPNLNTSMGGPGSNHEIPPIQQNPNTFVQAPQYNQPPPYNAYNVPQGAYPQQQPTNYQPQPGYQGGYAQGYPPIQPQGYPLQQL